MNHTHGRAFTLIELAAVCGACWFLGLLSFAAIQPDTDAAAKRKAAQAKDIAQIRGIGQAMAIWAQNHEDNYPLPSLIDKSDATIGGGGTTKNTTANIFSMLIFAGSLTPEKLVSPLEVNPNIVSVDGYEFKSPKKAAVPEKALWDPAFAADFTGDKKGGMSYAHQEPNDKRLPRWSNSFQSGEIAVGTRGPEIEGIDRPTPGAIAPRFANPPTDDGKGTRTCAFYGEGKAYTGNFAYNDNSVRQLKPGLTHGEPMPVLDKATHDFPTITVDGKTKFDIPFYDELDDMTETNTFLGIFIEAGTSKKEFKAIWD